MTLPEDFVRLARAHAHRRKLKFKRGYAVGPDWRQLGSGFFGEAWEHADHPGLVVKVSGRGGFGLHDEYTLVSRWNDPAPSFDSWQVYAQYCHKHPHKHLPNIMHFERINASTAWAIMPKYSPYNAETGQDFTRKKWQGWLGGERNAPEWLWPIIGMASSLCMDVDLHKGNVMLDADGTMIMTDPFSSLGYTSDYTSDYIS